MGIGLGYRPGATSVPAGGGGGALGDATIWPTVALWSDLSSITSPRDGDEVVVTDADGSGSTVTAQWSSSGAAWVMIRGSFVGSLYLSFPNPIAIGAIAVVAWVDGVRGYVYADITVDAGAGGGTMPVWVPPEVAAGSPLVLGFFVGDEDAATLTAQGNAAIGTVATTGSEIELLSSGASTSRLLQSTSVATADRYYFRGLYRGDRSGALPLIATVYLSENAANDLVYIGSRATGLGFLTNGLVSVGTLRTPVTNIPDSTSTPVHAECVHNGMDVSTELYADGALLASYRGDLQTSGAGDFVISPLINAGTGGNTQLLCSQQVVIKW